MRKALAILLPLYAAAALAVQDCDIGGDHVNPDNGATTAGRTGIMRCRDRDSGQIMREEELRDGRFVGLVRYYRDGKLEREFRVNDNHNTEGLAREFYPDGRLAREANYRDGSIVGASRSWHPNGMLRRIAVSDAHREIASAEFNDRGQLQELHCAEHPVTEKDMDDKALCGHGAAAPQARDLFTAKGMLRGRVSHLDGRRVASETFWDNGKPQAQEEAGKGWWIERSFSREGVKRRETRWIAADRGRSREYDQEFHESGTLVHERRWQTGELASDKTWYLNGQLKTDHRFSVRDGRPVCEATSYHDNGKVERNGLYTSRNGTIDRPLGTQRAFDADGHLRSEREYAGDGRLAREREFDDKGRILRDDAVFEDGSRKAFAVPGRAE